MKTCLVSGYHMVLIMDLTNISLKSVKFSTDCIIFENKVGIFHAPEAIPQNLKAAMQNRSFYFDLSKVTSLHGAWQN